MSKYAYICIQRVKGDSHICFEPSFGINVFARLAHKKAEYYLGEKLDEGMEVTEDGFFLYSYYFRHTIYSICKKDLSCTGELAKKRDPKITMHLIIPGTPEIISKRFDDFCNECFNIGVQVSENGHSSDLKVIVPDDLYAD